MYDHRKIEKKWQEYWLKNKTYKAEIDGDKEKYYVLDMFPYPSGAGLHVGHVTGYTGTDIMARFMRMKGYNVLHPMGWDSFGLPAEQYAIRTGTHPAITTEKNINTYREQLQSLGFSYDWDREIATSNPDYSKWTQWIFKLLYDKGLAYEAKIHVNYCPELSTVLANEEVEDGRSKEGGYLVEKRPLRQWVLKITAYAERLLEDLDDLDWPDHLKRLQRNWIGKSVGSNITFKEKETKESISVFTTRQDTLLGCTYLVLAPEHPLVNTIGKNKEEIKAYQDKAALKSDLERGELAKEKTGVFTGAYAIHPISGKEIPIWIADYVLADYGSGAVMAVPGNDERDFEFARKYELSIIPMYEPDNHDEKEAILSGDFCYTGDGKSINNSHGDLNLNGLSIEKAKEKMLDWLEKSGSGKKSIHYKLRDWLFSRQRYWGEPIPILHFEDGTKRSLDLDELPLLPPDLDDYKPSGTGESPLAKVDEWVNIQDPKTDKPAKRETNTMPQWAGSCWYYLRFLDPQNDVEAWSPESENYWMPVDLYVGGSEHAVLHLLYARFWHKVLYDLKLVHTKEPFKTYRNQGLVTSRSYKVKGGTYVSSENAQEIEDGYVEKTTGEVLISQIEKMSKSKLNGVTPDDIVKDFGADALRLYEMFMGPFDKEKVWNTDAVSGCKRFLNRFYDMVTSEKNEEVEDKTAYKLGHRLVKNVTKDIESMQFNTAIARMMEFINDFIPLSSYPTKILKMAVQMLYPFAPHIAEELWEHLGENESITHAPLFVVDEKYLVEDTVLMVIQVNGKLRGKMTLQKDQKKEDVISMAMEDSAVKRHLKGDIVKTIFVPNKLLNIVVK